MARIVAIVPDLLFASRIQAVLEADGHEVEHRSSLEAGAVGAADLLIADLGEIAPEELAGQGVAVLGFYPHVDEETRRRAEAAGVDLVVPRSRMAREMTDLVDRLLAY